MRRTLVSVLAGPFFLMACLSCSDNPNGVKLFRRGASSVISPPATLDRGVLEILSLFPKGLSTAATARWTTIKQKYAAGLSDPAQMKVAKQMLFDLSAWISQKTPNLDTPPTGETKVATAARAVLYMSMYVYGGPGTSPPPFIASADNAVGLVTPGAPATIVTPTTHAGVKLEAGSVAENTIIVITQNPTHFDDNCSGPLQTKFCQYPQFYTFEMFPHARLIKAATFNVCHINSGETRRPLADHDRFSLAHAKPADPANYVPGGRVFDQNGESIEVLPRVHQTFSTCVGNFYASNVATGGELGVFSRIARRLQNLITPRTAYAIDVGLGGLSFDMSPFNVLDTLSSPDLAVQSVSIAPALAHGGDHLALSYSVTNIGTASRGTSHATLFLTPTPPPGYEGPPLADQPLGGSFDVAPLAPQATVSRTGIDVLIPPGITAGGYQLTLVIDDDPIFPDANLANNAASTPLSIVPSNITILGVLPGDNYSIGQAINNAGHAVGYSASNTSQRPFIWINGQMTSLGTLGGSEAQATGINDVDEVVGVSRLVTGEVRAFRWKDGAMTNLGTLPGTNWSAAVGINLAGQVVGHSNQCEGSPANAFLGYCIGTITNRRLWIWQNGVMTDLGMLPGFDYAYPYAINDVGQIVGYGGLTGSEGLGPRGWIWQSGSVTIIPTEQSMFATAINNEGVAAGFTFAPSSPQEQAVEWANGAITNLGYLPGDQGSQAAGINVDRQIVGASYVIAPDRNNVTRARAFFWDNGRMIDLGTLGGDFSAATGINSSRQIVGWSTTSDGKQRAILWQAPLSP